MRFDSSKSDRPSTNQEDAAQKSMLIGAAIIGNNEVSILSRIPLSRSTFDEDACQEVQELLKSPTETQNVNRTSELGMTALGHAVAEGHLEVASEFLHRVSCHRFTIRCLTRW